MTEMTSTIPPKSESKTQIKHKGGTAATFAVILAMITAGAVSYLYYIGLKTYTNMAYQQQTQNRVYQNYVATTDAAINTLNQSLNQLQNKIESANNSSANPVNYQLNELISLANQSILIYHDPRTTVKLLNYVKNLLEGNNNAAYVLLKVAVVDDLAKLERITPIDSTLTSAQLNAIISQIDNLKPMAAGKVIGEVAVDDRKYQSKWQEFLHNLKAKLFGLVQVSRYTTNQRQELLPEQEFLLRQNIKLDILNARIALLQNDGKTWHYSLNDAKTKLGNYFVMDNNLQLLINQINNLDKLDINMPDANIDGVLKALNKLNNLGR